jgi:hypothetical protein
LAGASLRKPQRRRGWAKALIPIGSDILFRFLNLKPDIIGYAERHDGRALFTVEVKQGKPTVKDIYQAKLYKELFGAGIGFLITSAPIPEELKRLIRNRADHSHVRRMASV